MWSSSQVHENRLAGCVQPPPPSPLLPSLTLLPPVLPSLTLLPPVLPDPRPDESSRSFKLGRQRSSSGESAGESGNSTTSEEGEGLKRLSSRRPPLPAGWGLPYASNVGAAAADGSAGGSGVGGVNAEAGGKSDGASGDGGSTPPDGVAWGAREEGGSGLPGEGGSSDNDDGGGDGREDAVEGMGGREGSPPETDSLSFEREVVVGEPEDDAPLPPSPKRANSQDSTIIDDDDNAAEDCPPLTLAADIDDGGGGAGVSVEGVQEGVMPPTPIPGRAALPGGGVAQGGAFVFDFGGDFLDVQQEPSQRGERNLTPPPWDGGRIGSGVFSPPLDMSPPVDSAPFVPAEVKSDGFAGEGVVGGREETIPTTASGDGEVRRGDELGGSGEGGGKMDDTPLLSTETPLLLVETPSLSKEKGGSTVEGGLAEEKVDVGEGLVEERVGVEEERIGVARGSEEERIAVAGKLDGKVDVAGEPDEERIGELDKVTVAGELDGERIGVVEEGRVGVAEDGDDGTMGFAGELDNERVGVGGNLNEERVGVGGELKEEVSSVANALGGESYDKKIAVGGGFNAAKTESGGDLSEEKVCLGGKLHDEVTGVGGELDEEGVEAGAAVSPAASPDGGTLSEGSSRCTSGVEDAEGESAGSGPIATEAPVEDQESGRVVVVSLAAAEGECAEQQEPLPLAQEAAESAADRCVISACMAVGKGLEEAERTAGGVDSVDGRKGLGVGEQQSRELRGMEGLGDAGGDTERK